MKKVEKQKPAVRLSPEPPGKLNEMETQLAELEGEGLASMLKKIDVGVWQDSKASSTSRPPKRGSLKLTKLTVPIDLIEFRRASTKLEVALLVAIRKIAEEEGLELHSLIEEALVDLVDKKNKTKPRAHLMAHLEDSIAQFGPLYEKLAK